MQTIAKLLLTRDSLRAKLGRALVRRTEAFSYETRVRYSAIERPHYGYCLLRGARLARRLGHDRMSVIEFGVAGGSGLLNLEMHAAEVERLEGVEIEIYGFDTGGGLPPPTDYRDLPHQWREGFFEMDVAALRARLSRAELVLGPIEETLPNFGSRNPAPVGAIMMDLDYYSSTVHALRLFDVHRSLVLPRAFVYLDDILGDDLAAFSEHTGVRLAINEFNAAHGQQKIDPTTYLVEKAGVPEAWHHQIYLYHDFADPEYCRFVAAEDQQLSLGATRPS